MWMMGYNEPHEDHINNGNRKLRPLVPRPPPPTYADRFHSTHHQNLVAAEQNKREFNSQQMVVVSSRWNPTPEQLQTLEELYRRGTRTPSADEIQHITAQLRRYGKIEGKNVFYWFQNHKARERQKRRRQLDNPTNDLNNQPPFFTTDINTINLDDPPIIQTKHPEIEETRNWAIPTFSEKGMLREKTGNADYRKAITIGDHQGQWIQQQHQQFDEDEEEEDGNDEVMYRRRKSIIPAARNATWTQMMQCLSTPCNNNHITLINSTTCTPTIPATFTTSDMDSYETLELFPVNSNAREQTEKCFFPTSDVSLSPRQFIEFLPLKN